MHEIRATVPPEFVSEAADLALRAGIERVAVSAVFVRGPEYRRHVVSAETSTPKARAFMSALLDSPVLANVEFTVTSRELRAILSREPLETLTQPMIEPFPGVIQDLWQLSHVTPSYLGRVAEGAVLLASGIMDDSPIAIVVAALFLPFLSQVLAVSLSLWGRHWKLLRQGLWALTVSTILALAAGAGVALIQGGPIHFQGFKGPLSSLLISTVIGIAAGLSSADDAGRRYLIGVAAAVQFAIFPVWFGAALVTGLPAKAVVISRLLSFGINLAAISGTALLAYAALHFKGGRFSPPRSSFQSQEISG